MLFFLRKVRIFNKGRYSKIRTISRVIFFFAIYLNIFVVYGTFFCLYGLSFHYSCLWVFLFVCYASFLINFFWKHINCYVGILLYF